MNHLYRTLPCLGLILTLGLPGLLSAKVTEEQAKALGTTLTRGGAEAGANADGRIPAFAGKWLGVPPQFEDRYDGSYNLDPYADEKPLFEISGANYKPYADQLSEGQKGLFEKYPDTYRIVVYPTHRDFRLSDQAYENIRLNALNAELDNDGLTLKGAYGGTAFPMPKDGDELVFNLFTANAPWFSEAPQISAYVFSGGNIAWSELAFRLYAPFFKGDARAQWTFDDIYSYSITEQIRPPRDNGKISFTSNTFDFVGAPRQAWQYDPGSRRLRKAPDVGFDYPMDTGPRVVDEQNGFNGSPERFTWKLVGKREMFVPANNYKYEQRGLPYAEITKTRGFPNPELLRHELRRVWVLEATLKDGMRHIYSKRRLYIDEDSWFKVLGETYDRRGELWRVSQDAMIYAYDSQTPFNNVSFYEDLQAGSYSAEKLNSELEHGAFNNRREPRPNEFTLDGIRRSGR